MEPTFQGADERSPPIRVYAAFRSIATPWMSWLAIAVTPTSTVPLPVPFVMDPVGNLIGGAAIRSTRAAALANRLIAGIEWRRDTPSRSAQAATASAPQVQVATPVTHVRRGP